jgi:integrase/recombinase XerD
MGTTKSNRIYRKVVLKANKIKAGGKGEGPIWIRITIDRKPHFISLGKFVHPDFWDAEKGVVLKGAGNAQKLNHFIIQEINKIDRIILDLENDDKEVSFEKIKKLYVSDGKLDFIEFCRAEIALRKGELSPRTIEDHNYILGKLEKYQAKIKISAIDFSWLTSFEHYLRNTLGNGGNTVATTVKFVRTYYNRAVKGGLCKKKEIDWNISFTNGDRNPLTKAELSALYQLFENTVTGQNAPIEEMNANRLDVLRCFLFPCFAGGLRFSDVRRLKWKRIETGENGKRRLHIRTSKTGEKVYVPLSPKALKLLPGRLSDEDLVFQTYDNKWTNRLLEEVFKLADIKRKATFHYSRHTFATVSLSLKMNKQVIKRIMGIRSDKVMDIYGKIVDDLVDEEMQKWDAF